MALRILEANVRRYRPLAAASDDTEGQWRLMSELAWARGYGRSESTLLLPTPRVLNCRRKKVRQKCP